MHPELLQLRNGRYLWYPVSGKEYSISSGKIHVRERCDEERSGLKVRYFGTCHGEHIFFREDEEEVLVSTVQVGTGKSEKKRFIEKYTCITPHFKGIEVLENRFNYPVVFNGKINESLGKTEDRRRILEGRERECILSILHGQKYVI
jgi:hypothetical protein